MLALLRDEKKQQGISLLTILGIPTGAVPAGHHGLGYLLGITGRMVHRNIFTWDGILHYDFNAKHLLPESGFVIKTWESLFATLDLRATLKSKSAAAILPGVKYAATPSLFVGVGYQESFGAASTFDRQFYLQVEFGRH